MNLLHSCYSVNNMRSNFHLENSFMMQEFYQYSLREKCLYSELFRSVFSRIRTEYGEILPTDTFYAM